MTQCKTYSAACWSAGPTPSNEKAGALIRRQLSQNCPKTLSC
jgi:hypothetical protein